MEAPLPPNEAQRLAALQHYAILDTAAEVAFDRITALAVRLFNVPMALVSLMAQDRQWFKSAYGLTLQQTPRDVAFCAHTILADRILVVPDTTKDARFMDNPLVTGPPYVRFYAGAPLKVQGDFNLGGLCILDTVSRELSQTEQATLFDLSALIVDELELRLAAREYSQLATAIQNLGTGVIITDPSLPDNPIIFSNPAFSALTGYSAEEVQGRNCRFLQGPDTDAGWVQAMRQAVAAQSNFQGVVLNYRKDGSPFWNKLTINPVRDQSDAVIYFTGLQEDVTELYQTQADLQEALQRAECAKSEAEQAKAEAERANLAKSEFLSRMSHELRTPMHAILGFGQLLEMDNLPEQQHESVQMILDGGRHLLGLINEVLDVTRIESGRMEFSLTSVKMRDVVLEALALLQPLADRRHIQIKPLDGNLTEPSELYVTADSQRLKQVLLNLLGNAIKYNRDAGQITITGEVTSAQKLRLLIADTGPGIAPEKLNRLFVPFDRLGADNTVEGSGLGLALAQRLMGAMGGTLEVSSVVGQGSTFCIELPQTLSQDETAPPMDGTRAYLTKSLGRLYRKETLQEILS